MATSYYAWTPIRGGTTEKPINVALGEKVTHSKLEISEADFQAMIDSGAVREKPYPVPEEFKGSAVDFVREQLAEMTTVGSDLDEAEAQAEVSKLEKTNK